jgi:cytochrome b561
MNKKTQTDCDLGNTLHTYGRVARLLHWAMAVLLLGMGAVGYWMVGLPPTDDKWWWYGVHKSFGLIVLALSIMRLSWRFLNVVPELSRNLPQWQVMAGRSMVVILYGLMIVMPTTGVLMSFYGGYPIKFFELFTIPAASVKNTFIADMSYTVHGWGFWIMLVAVAVHVGAALYHHFVLKDQVLRRMLTGL